ncbi:MAG: CinA family protein [Pseudomonadota bacterium]
MSADPEIAAAAHKALETLRARAWTVATAESCTGGMIAAALTDIAGSSDVVLGGWVTYSNAMKARQLGVEAATLAAHGAVSEPVATAMAVGARDRADAEVAVSVTGVAGPGGGSAEKPVGLVWFGYADEMNVRAHRMRFDGDRAAVRRAATLFALTLLSGDGMPTAVV